eukprot:gene15589-biopygen13528
MPRECRPGKLMRAQSRRRRTRGGGPAQPSAIPGSRGARGGNTRFITRFSTMVSPGFPSGSNRRALTQLRTARSLAYDAAGALLIGCYATVRRVAAGGDIATVVGTDVAGYSRRWQTRSEAESAPVSFHVTISSSFVIFAESADSGSGFQAIIGCLWDLPAGRPAGPPVLRWLIDFRGILPRSPLRHNRQFFCRSRY